MAKGKGSSSKSSKKSKKKAKATAKKGNTGKQTSKSKAPAGKPSILKTHQYKTIQQKQQELSNKFGITTFTPTGAVSTKPVAPHTTPTFGHFDLWGSDGFSTRPIFPTKSKPDLSLPDDDGLSTFEQDIPKLPKGNGGFAPTTQPAQLGFGLPSGISSNLPLILGALAVFIIIIMTLKGKK
jgi:hypothetical protein